MNAMNALRDLRTAMKHHNIDAYIVPSSDPHCSEYLPEYFKGRSWLSGFSGSRGTLVVTANKAALWTDGRYFIQAEKEMQGRGIDLMRIGVAQDPIMSQWLNQELEPGSTVGFDGFTFMAKEAEDLSKALSPKDILFNTTTDLITPLWLDRPPYPSGAVSLLDEDFSGESTTLKLERIRRIMVEKQVSCHLLAKLDDIAWITNLRGSDIPHNPYFLSFMLIDHNEAVLYVEPSKINSRTQNVLRAQGVHIKPYKALLEDLGHAKCPSVLLDKSAVPYQICVVLGLRSSIIDASNPSTALKAIKNPIEQKHLEECYRNDGVAMVKFMYWLEHALQDGLFGLSEFTIDAKLTSFRAMLPHYVSQSFDTIAAYGDHGAMMHYKASRDHAYPLEPKGLFLVDSGGQYLTGTTDITRTLALGPLTDQERFDYTLTLKSMLCLSRAQFLATATGTHLDILARQHMWQYGLDYKCGTGHGIGFYLGVHEGPHSISMNPSSVALAPGMVVTNEPGVYRTGVSGVRIEDTLLVEAHSQSEFGNFNRFKTLTLCPYDRRAILAEMLTSQEVEQIDAYHSRVFHALKDDLEASEIQWLKEMTAPLAF